MWLRRPMWTDAAAAHAVIFKAAEAAFRGDVHLIENLIGIASPSQVPPERGYPSLRRQIPHVLFQFPAVCSGLTVVFPVTGYDPWEKFVC